MAAGEQAASTLPGLHRGSAFSRLWAGQTASLAGTQVSKIALPLVAIQTLQAGPFAVTVVSVLSTLPFLIFGLPAGVWVDRTSQRKVMIWSDVGRACAMLTMPLCVALGAGAGLAWLYVVTAVVGALTVFFDVAYGSYVPSIVSGHELEAANGRLALSDTLSRLVGPGVAGVLVQWVGAALAVVADGVSYVASVAALSSIRAEPSSPSSRPVRAHGQLRAGLTHVFGNPVLRALLVTGSILNLCDAGISALLLLLLTRTVGLTALQIGVAFGVGACGGILGAARPRPPGLSRRRAMVVALLSVSAARLTQAMLPTGHRDTAIALLVVAQLLAGYGAVSFNVLQVSLRQRMTPAPMLGRMTATMRMALWGTLPIGAALAGGLATWWDVRGAAVVAAAGTLLAPLCLATMLTGRARAEAER